MQKFQVKEYNSEDFSASLSKAHKSCFPDKNWPEKDFLFILKNPNRKTLLLLDKERVVGFSIFSHVDSTCEIISLGIEESLRANGLGNDLLRETINECKILNANNIFLEVAIDNKAAIHLYEKFGFEIIGRRKEYYKRPDGRIDALTYSLKI